MRKAFAAFALTLAAALPVAAEVSVSISINVPSYPTLQRIPQYPVYYAPSVRGNYFFYDGLYWVYDRNEWYASTWYNGPWEEVDRYEVPDYILRVPVRYYRAAPTTFHSVRADAPPQWQAYWGSSWETRRSGWESWDIKSAPAPAPLPVYQRTYTRDSYPSYAQQVAIQKSSYRYQPRDSNVQVVYKKHQEKAKDRRGPPDHAVAKGLRNRDDDKRGPPSHAPARGLDRDDRGDRRGPPDHAKGKAKGHDRDDDRDDDRGQGKGKGKDKDKERGRNKD